MEFVVIARDGRDPDAKARRAAQKAAHLEGTKSMKADKRIRAAGAILDDAGDPVGSVVFCDFPSRADLDAWLKRDPYVTGGVWKDIEVLPFHISF